MPTRGAARPKPSRVESVMMTGRVEETFIVSERFLNRLCQKTESVGSIVSKVMDVDELSREMLIRSRAARLNMIFIAKAQVLRSRHVA